MNQKINLEQLHEMRFKYKWQVYILKRELSQHTIDKDPETIDEVSNDMSSIDYLLQAIDYIEHQIKSIDMFFVNELINKALLSNDEDCG